MSYSIQAQDFMNPQAFRDYLESMNHMNCTNPKNKDRWQIRKPTKEEIIQLGQGILVFEYWNNLSRCSDSYDGGVYFENLRFHMIVEVLGEEYDSMERITLSTEDTQYRIFSEPLMLHDGDKPERIILYPLVS